MGNMWGVYVPAEAANTRSQCTNQSAECAKVFAFLPNRIYYEDLYRVRYIHSIMEQTEGKYGSLDDHLHVYSTPYESFSWGGKHVMTVKSQVKILKVRFVLDIHCTTLC
jgi:hypothetical protein